MRVKKHNIYVIAAAICIAAFFCLIFIHYASYRKVTARWDALSADIEKTTGSFNGTVSVVIKDLKRPLVIAINPEIKLPSASLVKIPIMASAFRADIQKRLTLDYKVVLKHKDKTGGSGILKNSPSGAQFTLRQLIELMITISDNTASNMIINLLGFDYINASFKDFGLTNTNLSRLMMDMRSRDKGIENFTAAKDMALILEKIYYKKLVNKRVSAECLETLKEQRSRDRIPARLPKGTIVAHKTGLERGICHDAGIVFTDNGNFIICVLTKHRNKSSRPSKKLIAKIAYKAYCFYMPDSA